MVNLYEISADGEAVAFVRQKRMALREDIRFFADESETEEVFRVKARRVVDIGGRYDVVGPGGERIGVLEKRFRASLLRSTWGILDADEREVGLAEERSMAVAIVRRVKDLLPYGELLPLRYHFTFRVDGRPVGELTRELAFRDRYALDLTGDVEHRIERRLAVALAVALDALQAR